MFYFKTCVTLKSVIKHFELQKFQLIYEKTMQVRYMEKDT